MVDAEAATPNNRVLWSLVVIVFLDFVCVGFIMPVVPGMVRTLLAGNEAYGWVTGALQALSGALQFLCGALFGVLSDRVGRKPVLGISVAGLALANLLRGLAPNIWIFAVGTMVSGVTSATSAVALATASDLRGTANKAHAFGLISAAVGAGFIVGPVLGGIAAASGLRFAYLVAASLSLLTAVLVTVLLPETHSSHRRSRFSWGRANPLGSLLLLSRLPGRLGATLSFFLFQCAMALFPASFVLYLTGALNWNATQIGATIGILATIYVLAQASASAGLIARLGVARTSAAALLAGAIGLALLSAPPALPLIAVAVVAISVSALAQPTLKLILSAELPAGEQGELQGGLEGLAALARMISPAIFGLIFSEGLRAGSGLLLRLPFALAAGGMLIAAVLIYLFGRASAAAGDA